MNMTGENIEYIGSSILTDDINFESYKGWF